MKTSGATRTVILSYGIAILAFAICGECSAEALIKVSQAAWANSDGKTRAIIQEKYIVQIISDDDIGLIIDNQGVNESSPGTTGGAVLGGALAQTAYIDRAIKGGNYSATNQLGLGILGAILGSSIDQKPTAQFHFRYALKTNHGEIRYIDKIESTAFRLPVGVCVLLSDLSSTEQSLCGQTPTFLVSKYGIPDSSARDTSKQTPESEPVRTIIVPKKREQARELVLCKIGVQSPVETTEIKCNQIGGEVLR